MKSGYWPIVFNSLGYKLIKFISEVLLGEQSKISTPIKQGFANQASKTLMISKAIWIDDFHQNVEGPVAKYVYFQNWNTIKIYSTVSGFWDKRLFSDSQSFSEPAIDRIHPYFFGELKTVKNELQLCGQVVISRRSLFQLVLSFFGILLFTFLLVIASELQTPFLVLVLICLAVFGQQLINNRTGMKNFQDLMRALANSDEKVDSQES